jgi:hypothetical protein
MRRDAKQRLPLPNGLVNEMELTPFEISDAAVDQSGGATGGAACKIVALEQRHSEASHRGIPSDATARNSAADHEKVEFFPGESSHSLPMSEVPRNQPKYKEFDRKIRISPVLIHRHHSA